MRKGQSFGGDLSVHEGGIAGKIVLISFHFCYLFLDRLGSVLGVSRSWGCPTPQSDRTALYSPEQAVSGTSHPFKWGLVSRLQYSSFAVPFICVVVAPSLGR